MNSYWILEKGMIKNSHWEERAESLWSVPFENLVFNYFVLQSVSTFHDDDGQMQLPILKSYKILESWTTKYLPMEIFSALHRSGVLFC